jgi:hypothetical protein
LKNNEVDKMSRGLGKVQQSIVDHLIERQKENSRQNIEWLQNLKYFVFFDMPEISEEEYFDHSCYKEGEKQDYRHNKLYEKELSESQYQNLYRAIKSLEKRGIIERIRIKQGGGMGFGYMGHIQSKVGLVEWEKYACVKENDWRFQI